MSVGGQAALLVAGAVWKTSLGHHAPALQGWEAKELLYYGRHQKPKIEELGVKFEPNFDAFLSKCDVVRKGRKEGGLSPTFSGMETCRTLQCAAILLGRLLLRSCGSMQLQNTSHARRLPACKRQ